MTSKMRSELRASACLTLEMIFLPIKLRVTATSACRASDTVFRREIDSQRQWDYGTCYGDCFPTAKECNENRVEEYDQDTNAWSICDVKLAREMCNIDAFAI